MRNNLKPNEIRRAGTKSWPALLLLASCVAARAAEGDDSADGPEPVPPAAAPAQPAPARVQKVEAFALVGTASYGQDSFAFFDGNDANFKQLLHPNDQIAGCTVVAIAHDHVQLKTGDQVIELPVKMQLRRENAGEWKLLAMTENFTPSVREPEPREGSAPASQFTTRSSSSSKGSRGEPPPGEISEKALKKMEDQFKSAMKEEAKAEKELKSATAPTSGKSSKKSSKRSRQP